MLQLRPNCECCDVDLPGDAPGAYICSYECTFCERCCREVLQGACPNCGGELLPRPRRATARLAKHPASSERVRRDGGCAAAGEAPPRAPVAAVPGA